MAMLADPRKKSKYRLQPFSGFSKINKRCDDDTSSVAYKLMANMGWAPGKGLGRNESGNVDPIKLRLKNDEAGLGYKISEDDAIAQQSEFQALLLQLNSGATNGEIQPEELKVPKKPKIKSLEKQSEQSSVRVHYKKFTRGKDLSRASEKDLRSILGLSSKPPKVKKEEVTLPEPKQDDTEEPSANMYIIAGSSVDYFKNRYLKKTVEKETLEKEELGSEGHGNKRRSVTWGDVDVSYVDKYIKDMVDTSGSLDESLIDSECIEEPAKKKKKKKKNQQFSAEVSEENVTDIAEVKDEKKKKKKKRKMIEEDSCKENLSQELEDHSMPKKKRKQIEDSNVDENLVQEQEDHSKPKKKKKQKLNLPNEDEQILEGSNDMHCSETEALCPEEPTNCNLDLNEVPKQKKKKKKKKNQVCALPDQTY